MNKTEFVAKVLETFPKYRHYLVGTCPEYSTYPITEDTKFGYEWIIGGMTGGSCWHDSGATEQVEPEEEPSYTFFDEILEHFAPNLSWIDYKKYIVPAFTSKIKEDREYYGNYTKYQVKSFTLGDLYDRLSQCVEL